LERVPGLSLREEPVGDRIRSERAPVLEMKGGGRGLMETILVQSGGAALFLIGTVLLGRRVRRTADMREAQRTSRISHLLFWGCLLGPGLVGIIHPGLQHYDELLGLTPLPYRSAAFVLGLLLLSAGIGLMFASTRALSQMGQGSTAFFLTEQVVIRGVYLRTRNPMSLGFYMACVGRHNTSALVQLEVLRRARARTPVWTVVSRL
jgi:protein-S-isoprenylcysteine O-methyltransferase Ste14